MASIPGVTEWFDIMSYCANGIDSVAWISDRGWDDIINRFSHFPPIIHDTAAPQHATEQMLIVEARANSSGVMIRRIKPTGSGIHLPGVASPLRLVARASDGKVVADAPMLARFVVDGGRTHILLRAIVPANAVASVEIVHGTTVLAKRTRSAHAPAVTILSPERGTRIGGRRNVVVRWRANDADGDRLSAKVDYSKDDGVTWRALFAGPNRGTVTLPSSYFTGSYQARIRVRMNDGFNESYAVSGRLVSVGSSPTVYITDPSPGEKRKIMNNAVLRLSGIAHDDAFKQLTGLQLRWYTDRKLLGTGSTIDVTGLRPGMRRIQLLARDAQGRVGKATVVVEILAQNTKPPCQCH
jgi:hypothetical protein